MGGENPRTAAMNENLIKVRQISSFPLPFLSLFCAKEFPEVIILLIGGTWTVV